MKKKRILGLLTLAPLALLSACGGGTPALTLTANWYKNTALSDNISDTHERLEYKVEYVEPTAQNDFTVSYKPGTYVAELNSEVRTLSDGTKETVYVYTTSFTISGNYALGEEKGETFEDSLQTSVVFRNIKQQLQPVESTRTQKTTSPISLAPTSIQTASEEYYFKTETTYDENLTKATVVYTDLKKENGEPSKREISLGGTGTFLDNEQILFALRGSALTSALTFRSINSVQNKCTTLNTTTGETSDVALKGVTIGESAATDITVPAIRTSLSYNDGQSGGAQTLWYAKTDNVNSNTYRNALVCMETEIFYGLGVLRYTLVNAQFSEK